MVRAPHVPGHPPVRNCSGGSRHKRRDKHHYTRYVMDTEQSAESTETTETTGTTEPDPHPPEIASERRTSPACDLWRRRCVPILHTSHGEAHPCPLASAGPDDDELHADEHVPIGGRLQVSSLELFRIPFLNGFWFGFLLALVDAGLLLPLALVWHGHNIAGILGIGGWSLVVGGLLSGFSIGFRPKNKSWRGGLALGIAHTAAHAGLVTAIYYSMQRPYSGWTPLWPWPAAIGLAAVVAWATFSLFLFLCDTTAIRWHENEFFSGMKFESYKSHLRISIERPKDGEAAGKANVAVHVIKDPPKNRKHGTRNSPIVKIHESFDVDDLSLPEASNS